MTAPEQVREAVALTIINQVRADHGLYLIRLDDVADPSPYFRQADAILALPNLFAHGNMVPSDWVMVPRESTFAMNEEGWRVCTPDMDVRRIYAAMLAAAPAPPADCDDVVDALAEIGQFLVDRLNDLEFGERDECLRDFHGHVLPALSRMEAALTRYKDPSHD